MPRTNPYLGFAVTYLEIRTNKVVFGFLGRTYNDFAGAHMSFNESVRAFPGWAVPIAFWKIKFKESTIDKEWPKCWKIT